MLLRLLLFYFAVVSAITVIVGVFLLSSAVQGWFIGIGLAVAVVAVQRIIKPKPGATVRVSGMD